MASGVDLQAWLPPGTGHGVSHVSHLKRLLILTALISSPLGATPPETTGDEKGVMWLYTVRRGDTLITVAARYLARVERWTVVQKINQIVDPTKLMPGTVLRIPAAMLRRQPAEVTVEASSGQVRWRSADQEWQPVSRGLCLQAGSIVETLEGGRTLLRLADGSTLTLSEHSQVTFDVLGSYAGGLMVDSRLRMQNGQADVYANPARRSNRRLQIFTPSAQAVVRGTQFRLGVERDRTRQETLTGQVLLKAAGKQVLVPVGRGTIARHGKPPMAPVTLLGQPDVSTFPGRFESLPLRFPLPALKNVHSWHGEIVAEHDQIMASKNVRGPTFSVADLPNGDYTLRLRGIDANGLQGMDAVHPFTVFARPFPPELNTPGKEATIRNARPVFAWSEIDGTVSYRLQVATEDDFSQPLHDIVAESTHWQVPVDLPAGRQFWRVKSIDAQGETGPWSVSQGLTFKPGPGAIDPGQVTIDIGATEISLNLPKPPDELFYEALLSPERVIEPVVARRQSTTGELSLPRPNAGTVYLGLRLVDSSDETRGPLIVHKVDIPLSRWWLLLLLLPMAM